MLLASTLNGACIDSSLMDSTGGDLHLSADALAPPDQGAAGRADLVQLPGADLRGDRGPDLVLGPPIDLGADLGAAQDVDGAVVMPDGAVDRSDATPPVDATPPPDQLMPQLDAGPNDYCTNRVSDNKVHALGPLANPAVGVWVTDPDFGTKITRVTASVAAHPITPVYSTVPAWNADGSLLLLYEWGSGHLIYDAKTLALVGPLDCTTKDGWHPAPSDVEHVMWDTGDPQMLYYPSRYAPNGGGPLPNLYRCNVKTHVAEVVHDFTKAPTSCGKPSELLMGSDPQWYPGAFVGLLCGAQKFVYDMKADRVYTPRSGAEFADDLAPIVAPSGTVAFYNGFVYDLDLKQLRKLDMAVPDEHANIGRNKAGDDFYYAVDYDGKDPGVIQAHDLQTGTRTPLVAQSLGWGYPPSGVHITSVNDDPRAHGWVMASVVGNPRKIDLFTMELVLANIDNKKVCRVGRHRSWAGEGQNGYQAEPHPVFHILKDGTLEAAFASDWGNSNIVDTYLVRIPSN